MFRIANFIRELDHPTVVAPRRNPPGPVVIWNLIRRCNLTCEHCYSISADKDFPGELNTDEVFKVKRQDVVDDTITGADKVRRVIYLTRGVTPTLSPQEFHTYAEAVGQDVEVLYDGQLHHGAYRGPVKVLRKRLEN